MTIYFDLDGTLANLYAVINWLEKLRAYDATPYEEAEPILNLSRLARQLNKLSRAGYRLGIVSWLSKSATAEYNFAVVEAKLHWLNKHLPSVHWDEIKIIPYGVPKSLVVNDANGILFDDEEKNRLEWTGKAFTEKEIFEILASL